MRVCERAPHAVSSTNAASSASKASGVSQCGVCPAPGMTCTAPRHSVGMAIGSEIAAVDELLVGAMQHGERNSKIAHHRDLVAGPAGRDAGPEIAARPPVRSHDVFHEERRNVGETRLEKRGDVGGRLLAVDMFAEGEAHRRIWQEGLAHVRREGERRRAEDHEPARVR